MATPRVNHSLHPSNNAEHEAGPATSTVFQVFDANQSGIESNLSAVVARGQS